MTSREVDAWTPDLEIKVKVEVEAARGWGKPMQCVEDVTLSQLHLDGIDEHGAQRLNLLSSLFYGDIQLPIMMSRSSTRFHLCTKTSSNDNVVAPRRFSSMLVEMIHSNNSTHALFAHAAPFVPKVLQKKVRFVHKMRTPQ